MSFDNCSDCRFFDNENTTGELGKCRRNAPRSHLISADVDADEQRVRGVWPLVSEDDWCGQFEKIRKRRGAY
jgi:hypothetical protein